MTDAARTPTDTANQESVLPAAVQRPVSRIEAIDGLRALAMFMVFTFHSWQFAQGPILIVHIGRKSMSIGSVFASFPNGVDLFMVLSGFCLFWPLVKSEKRLNSWSTGVYLKRRFRRIAPPYYAAILFATLLPNALVVFTRLAGRPGNWQHLPSAWQFISHFLFIHTLFLNTWTGIQGSFWSLGLEMQFYLAFPLVVLCYRRYGVSVMAGMVLISIAYRVCAASLTQNTAGELPFVVTIFFVGRWMQFAAGMAAAWLVANCNDRGTTLSAGVGAAMVASAVAIYFIAISSLPKTHMLSLFPVSDLLLATAFGVAIVALCVSSTPIRSLFENRFITWLGYISYSVFLIHQNAVFYIGEFFRKVYPLSGVLRFALLEIIGFVVVVCISTLFFKLFEAPFVNDPRKPPRTAFA